MQDQGLLEDISKREDAEKESEMWYDRCVS